MQQRADDVTVIPVVEERPTITKTVTETGQVSVRTLVDTHQETVSDTLHRSSVDVVRVPIGRFVDVTPIVEERDGTTIVPVVEERLVVEKRLFLVEEVHLTRKTTLEAVSQTLTLRSTRAVVDRETYPNS